MRLQRRSSAIALILTACSLLAIRRSQSVEIPLDQLTPIRIGFVDLQRVFDTYPEKSFAEGDLLREIEKRKRELNRRQTEIGVLREQITADQNALTQARAGQPVLVPVNNVPAPAPVQAAPAPVASTATVKASTNVVVEPYPTDDPLAGLPGHGGSASAQNVQPVSPNAPTQTLLDLLASATGPTLLSADAVSALERRIADNKRALDRSVTSFKSFRGNAVADMKQLQTEKTYGVMSRIYAVLQGLARDEGITVVIDKSYVLYGEDAVDLSDKLITRLQTEEQ